MSSHPPAVLAHAAPSGESGSRISRLLRIVQAIRQDPHRTLSALQAELGIGRSQFYKDKAALAEAGFRFSYSKKSGFRILEDALVPNIDLSLSNRLILMLALEQLCLSGDGMLAALAVDAGRKLAGGMPAPFREQMLSTFDRSFPRWKNHRPPETLSLLLEAVSQGRRIRILYTAGDDWDARWREIDPRHLYLRQRALYLYARTVDESPFQWQGFRVSRIRKVEDTGMRLFWPADADDGFRHQQPAPCRSTDDNGYPVTIRFTGQASHYIREKVWRESRNMEQTGPEEILFTVRVSDPQEVVRGARVFGDEAEVMECGEPAPCPPSGSE